MNQKMNLGTMAGASILRKFQKVVIESLWTIEHWRGDALLAKRIEENLCPDEFINHVLDIALSGGAQITAWYLTLFYHVERESDAPAGIGGTQENSLTFRLPRSGHFVAKVRACVDSVVAGCDMPPCYSDWSESIDPEVAMVDGEPRSWWLYGYVAPPGAIIINSQEGP